ncbi:Tetratricopeptide TPR_1 repeat-containing protein [Desulfurispirillum indicum S5]|uniref:Tetratricopeptide TPR_1 repeat-containing protein n=1 Tax=Desulfurispirillum indicum (strain ATCC BAA-1389 / DSM 22839 / S5) TaxID=653733 RepID=E6W376_DESIS|nr:tetratricopeptide repeat protein [Desulfurispirillum indicum]ADU66830.1 Tetratricopeptide TPR_1 repeat-containing protein [Desulfurispirillum indicum S5]
MARQELHDQLAFLDDDDHAPLFYRLLQKIPVLRDNERVTRIVLKIPDPHSRKGMLIYGGSVLGVAVLVGLIMAVIQLAKEPEYEKPVEDPQTVLLGVSGQREEPEKPWGRSIHLERGDQYFLSGDYSRAINEYSLAIGTDAALAYHNLGVIYTELGDFKKAIESFQRAIAARPSLPESYSALGLALHEVSRNVEALQYHLQALRLDPDNSEFHNNVGNAYLYLGDYANARRHYTRAIEINPSNTQAMANQNSLLLITGDYDAAIQGFREILSADPDNYEVLMNLGMAYRKNGNQLDALEFFRRAQQVQRTPNVFISIGDTFRDLNRPEDAINAYVSASNITSSTYPLKKLAEYFFVLMRYPEMEEMLEQIFATEPWFPRGEELTSYAQFLQGQESLALSRLKRLLRRNPENLHALRGYTSLQLIQADLREARHTLESLLKYHPNEPISNALRGEYLRKLRAFDLAEEHLRQQDNDIARYYLGKLLLERNRKEEGRAVMEQVSRSTANPIGPKAHYALMLENLGSYDIGQAVEHFEGALAKGVSTAKREYVPRFLISDRYTFRLTYAFSPFTSATERYLEYARPFLLETDRMQSIQESALSSYEQSLYRVAYRQFLRATQHADAARLNNKGVERSLSGDLVRALEYFQQAAAQERGNPIIQYNIALTYQKMGSDRTAEKMYHEIKAAAPQLYEVDINLAVMDARRGDDEAVVFAMQGLENSIVNAYNEMRERSLEDYDPKISDPRLALLAAIAQFLYQDDQIATRDERFQELPEQFPEFYEGLLMREVFTGETFAIPPRLQVNPRFIMLSGDRALLREEYTEAMAAFQRLYNQEANFLSSTKIGIAFSRMQQHKRGNRYFSEAAAIQPSIAALNNLGNSFADVGDYENLQKAYESALEEDQGNFIVAMNYAYANQQFRRYNFAREVFEVASKINPSNPMPYYNLAKIHLMYGRHFMAREELFRGLNRYPNMPTINYLMGLVELIDGNLLDSLYYLKVSVENGIDATDLGDIVLTYQIH